MIQTECFTDLVLEAISGQLAAHPPERGGALLEAGGIIHALVEDSSGVYTGVSWDISAQLTEDVRAAETAGWGRLAATVHTHPPGVPDPSAQDLRATARVLDENPHLDRIAVCIVTGGTPRDLDLAIGATHRMSIHVARRGPRGTSRVTRARAEILPIGDDAQQASIPIAGARQVQWRNRNRLAFPLEQHDDTPRLLLVPDEYPAVGPLVLTVYPDGQLALAPHLTWDPQADSAQQLRVLVSSAAGSRPEGFSARVERLVGRLAGRNVLVVGIGSVGSTVLNQLARAGVESFTVVDMELVDAANLSRTIYEARHIGMAKVDAAADIVGRINPHARVRSRRASIAELDAELEDLCRHADLVVAATDDPGGQALLSHHAYATGTPLVSAALYKRAEAGEVVISSPELDTPCWSCTIGGSSVAERPDKDYGTGRLVGELALGPPIHTVALVAAGIAIGFLAGPDTPAGHPLAELLASGRTLGIIATTARWAFFPDLFDGLHGHQWAPQSVWAKAERDPTCPVCGDHRTGPDPNLGAAATAVIERLRRELPTNA